MVFYITKIKYTRKNIKKKIWNGARRMHPNLSISEEDSSRLSNISFNS